MKWWRDWPRIAAFAALIAAVGLILFGLALWRSETSRARADALTTCRAKVAADLASAQVDNDVAFNEFVVAITDPTKRPYTGEIKRITDTGLALKLARDNRLAFEEHPTRDC